MERWDGRRWCRPLRTSEGVLGVWLTLDPRHPSSPRVEVVGGEPDPSARRRLASMVQDDGAAVEEVCRKDRRVAELRRLHPGVYPVRYLDPLGALLTMVTAQQVNLRFALSVRRALLLELGTRVERGEDYLLAADPQALAQASAEQMAALRLTRAKGRCLRALGTATLAGMLDWEELEALDDQGVARRLSAVTGLGPWTVDQFLTRVLGRPRVVAQDLGVRKAVQLAYGLPALPDPEEVRRRTSHYGAAAWTVQQLLLHHLATRLTISPRKVAPGPG